MQDRYRSAISDTRYPLAVSQGFPDASEEKDEGAQKGRPMRRPFFFFGDTIKTMISDSRFKKIIWTRYKEYPRAMPWRRTRNPYRILVSEIMLQQTQVSRVMGFYKTFITQFPDITALARAKTSDVLRVWQGLGYNRRAIALQKLAREVVEKYNGRLPRAAETLLTLPGIGPYTASAVRAFAFDEPDVFIETNIRRVFIHFFFPPNKKGAMKVTDAEIRRYIVRTLDEKNPREWYYALMDYGAFLGEVARRNTQAENPNRRSAHYIRQSKFAGSNREMRGKILRELLVRGKMPLSAFPAKIIKDLEKEGFLTQKGGYLTLL